MSRQQNESYLFVECARLCKYEKVLPSLYDTQKRKKVGSRNLIWKVLTRNEPRAIYQKKLLTQGIYEPTPQIC